MRIAGLAALLVILLLPITAILFLPGTGNAQMYVIQNEAYRSCSVSSDCVRFNMPCSAPISINRQYLTVFEQTKAAERGRFSCNVAKINPVNYPVCLGGYCSFGPRNIAPQDASDPRFCVSQADCQVAVDRCGRKFPVNRMNFATKQSSLDAAEDKGCDRTETRPVKEVHCDFGRCNVILDNYPGQGQ